MNNNQIVVNEINLLKSHAVEAIKIADRLTKRFDITSAARKTSGLTDEQKARFLAKKNKNKR